MPEYILDSLFANDKLAPIRGGERLSKPLGELNKYDQNLNRYLDQYDNRAANMSSWDARGNMLAQAGAEIIGGTIEGIGYLADIPQYINIARGTEEEFGNWFSDIGKTLKEQVREDFPIYGGDGFDPTSGRWWAKNAPSIASSLSLMIPSLGAVKAASLLNKATNLTTKASKLATGLKMVKEANKFESQLKLATKGLAGAMTSRYMEATMEASGKYDEEYKKLLSKGVSEEEAKAKAGKTASKVWVANQGLLLADFFQYKTLFGSAPTKLMNLGLQVVTEGLEEGVQYGFGKEAESSDNVLQLYGNVLQNFPEYFDDPEFLTSITMGAIGGGIFAGVGALTQGKSKSPLTSTQKDNIAKAVKNNQEYQKAVAEGDKTTATLKQDELLAEKSVEELEAIAETNPDLAEKVAKVIETKKASKSVSPSDDRAVSLSNYQLALDNKENSLTELHKDKYFQKKLEEFNKDRETPISPVAFTELLMKSREDLPNASKFSYPNLLIEDVSDSYKMNLREDLKQNSGKLVKAIDALRGLEGVIAKEDKTIDQIDEAPAKYKEEKKKEKKKELKKKPLEDLLQEESDEAIEVAAEKMQEQIDDAVDQHDTYEEYLEKQGGDVLINENVKAAFEGTEVQEELPENIQKVKSLLKPTSKRVQARVADKKYIEDGLGKLGSANPLRGLTQDQRVTKNPNFKNVREDLDKRLEAVDKSDKSPNAKIAEKNAIMAEYAGKPIEPKYILTNEEDQYLEPLLKYFNVTKEAYRNVIYNLNEYKDRSLEIVDYEINGVKGKAYVLDGKYPIALLPTIQGTINNLTKRDVRGKKLLTNPVIENGYLVSGDFATPQLENDFYALQDYYKYGGEVSLMLDEEGNIVYQKGQYNNQKEWRTLSDITDDALIMSFGNGKEVFNKEKPESYDRLIRQDEYKQKGFFYLVHKDTGGKYRLNRLYTKRLADHQESLDKLKEILTIAQQASMFFKGKVNKKLRGVEMTKAMKEVLDTTKGEFYESAELWFKNYTDYSREVIDEIAQTRDKNVYLDKALIFYFTDANGHFDPIAYLKKMKIFETTATDIQSLAPSNITKSIPVQIKVNNIENIDYSKLETNLKDINQPFVSPTFFFNIQPNEQRQETNQKEQTQEQEGKENTQEGTQEVTLLENPNFRVIRRDGELAYQYKRGKKWKDYKNFNAAVKRAKEHFGQDYELVTSEPNVTFEEPAKPTSKPMSEKEVDAMFKAEEEGTVVNENNFIRVVKLMEEDNPLDISPYSIQYKKRGKWIPYSDQKAGEQTAIAEFGENWKNKKRRRKVNKDKKFGDKLFKMSNEGRQIDIKKAKKNLKKILPNVPVSVIDSLIEIGDISAYGMASKAGITLSKLASSGTEFHEAFHIVFTNITKDKRIYLDSVEDVDSSLYNSLKDYYENPMDAAKEEVLSDRFELYMMGFQEKGIIGKLFKQIKEFIDFVLGNLTPTEKLFRDIRRGNYANKIKSFPDARYQVTDYTAHEEKQVINIVMSMLDTLISQDVGKGILSKMEDGYNTIFADKDGGYLLSDENSVLERLEVDLANSTGVKKQQLIRLIGQLRGDLVWDGNEFVEGDGEVRGVLYKKLLNRLHTRGLRFNGGEEIDEASIWKKYANISVSVKEGLSSKLKVIFNNLQTDVYDTLGLGYKLKYNGNEVFSMVLSEIGGSTNLQNMMDKIQNSKLTLVNRELYNVIINKPELQAELFGIAQKIHPTFYTILEEMVFKDDKYEGTTFKAIQSNRDSKRKLIRHEIHQAIGDQKEQLPLEKVLPPSVIQNIGNRLPDFQATFNKSIQKEGFNFQEFIELVEDYYPNSYQDAHLNVEGERVYEWQNGNFIGRQINKYNNGELVDFYTKDVLYNTMPLFKDNKTLEFTYLDGIKRKGQDKGTKFRNYSRKDTIQTMLEYFKISTKEMIAVLPILETAPTLAGVKVKKYSRKEAINHILDLAESEYARMMKTHPNIKYYNKRAKEGLIFGDVLDINADGINKAKTRKNIEDKIETLSLKLNLKIAQFDLHDHYPEGLVKDFIANHILNHTQLALFSVGDPAFYKSDRDYYKRAKEIHSPGIFLNTKNLPTKFKVKVVNDIEIRSPQADQIEQVIGKNSAYNKSSLTDAQTFIDPISYKDRMIGLSRWSDEGFEDIMNGKTSDVNWQVLKPFYYDLHEIGDTIVPVQKKDSEWVLYPIYGIKTINGKANPSYNETYKEILEGMGYEYTDTTVTYNENKRQYDVYTFDTTIKVGKSGDIMEFNYDSWRLQQETPAHYLDDSGNFGTQTMKLITADITDSELLKDVDEYNNLIIEDIEVSAKKVLKEFNDDKKLMKVLQEEVLDRGLGEEFLKGLEQLPYWHPFHTQRIQSMMNSMFRKSIAKRKFVHGFSFINSSGHGHKLEIKWNDETDPTKGVKYLEAKVPIYNSAFNKFIDETGQIDMEKIKGTPEEKMLEGLVYRIPTEDKFSMIPIKVVGFLPSNSGNILLPHEVTTMAGLDFDIDKVFGMYFGMTPPISEWVDTKPDTQEDRQRAVELGLEQGVKTAINKAKQERLKEEYDDYIAQVVRDNRKLEIMKKILSHPDTTKALLTPQGFDQIKKVNQDAKLENKEPLDFVDPMTLVEVANDMNMGQATLGIHANANVANAIFQQSEKPLTLHRKVLFDGIVYNQLGKKDFNHRITKYLGMRVGASADNGKDPQAAYYNSNSYTAPVEDFLILSGVDSDTVQLFLAQPLIKQFTESYFNNGGTTQAENDLLKKYKLNPSSNTPTKDVTKAVLKKELEKPSALQEELLEYFLIYKKRSVQVMELVEAVKIGDQGAGSNQIANEFKMNKFRKMFTEIENANEFLASKFFMFEMYRKGIRDANDTINTRLLPLGDGFRTVINQLARNKGYDLTEKEMQDVLNNMDTYAIHKALNISRDDVVKAVKALPDIKKKYPNNMLLKRMNVVDGFIEFIGAIGNDYSEVDDIKRAWTELTINEQDILMRYSFAQSGMSQTFKGFGHMQSVDYHVNLMEKYPQLEAELKKVRMEFDMQFLDQYIRNNYMKLTSVPTPSDNDVRIYKGSLYIQNAELLNVKYFKYKGILYFNGEAVTGLGVMKGKQKALFEYGRAKTEYKKNKVKAKSNVAYSLRMNPEDYLATGEIQKICK